MEEDSWLKQKPKQIIYSIKSGKIYQSEKTENREIVDNMVRESLSKEMIFEQGSWIKRRSKTLQISGEKALRAEAQQVQRAWCGKLFDVFNEEQRLFLS